MGNYNEINNLKEDVARWYNSTAYNKLSNRFQQTDFFKILGVSRKEDRHSRFIAWLLDPDGTHELGNFPIKQFLRLLAISKNKYTNAASEFPESFENPFIFGSFVFDKNIKCNVNSEYSIPARNTKKTKKKNSTDRLDIFIENLFIVDNNHRTEIAIVVENKILSSESDGQTQHYYDWLHSYIGNKYKNTQNDCIPICVFLYPEALNTKCDCDKYIKVTYQELVDLVIEPCLQKTTSDLTKHYISEYLKTLSYSVEDSQGELVMAHSKEERELCEAFFEDNKNLLTYVVGVLESMDDEDFDLVADYVRRSNKSSKRDYTKYSFNGDGKYGKRRLALRIFQETSITHKSIVDIMAVFEELFLAWPKVLIDDLGAVSDPDRYFHNVEETINLTEGDYYLAVDWGKKADGNGEFELLLKIARDDLHFDIQEVE